MARETTILVPGEADSVARWQSLWDRSPQRTVFSRLDYVTSVAAATDLETAVVFVSRDGSDVAGATVTWKRRGPYREIIVPPMTPFSAVLLAEAWSENEVHGRTSGLELLLEEIEQRFHAAGLHLPTAFFDARPATWRGWNLKPFYTYVRRIPTTPNDWSGSVARNFQQSHEEYEIVEGGNASDAAVHLCTSSYARHKRRPPLDEKRLSLLVNAGETSGYATSYGALRKETGTIDAAVVVARADETAYYWIAGSRPGPSMTVLVGEMFARLAADGVTTFDFVGANTPGIAEFKRKFGCSLVPYFRIDRVARPELKLLNKIRSILR